MDTDFLIIRELLNYLVPGAIAIVLGIPIVRVIARRFEPQSVSPGELRSIDTRLERIESAVELITVEVERMAEAQRFALKLQSQQAPPALANPDGRTV